MKTKGLHTFKTRLLLSAGALLLILAAPASAGFAQNQTNTNQMANRLDQLENQIQTLSRAVYRGEKMPMPVDNGSSASAAALSTMETRIADIEAQQRSMIGQIERVTHDVQQMKDRLERMAADYEQRFQQQGMGGGGVTGSSSSSSPAELRGDLYATEKPLPTGTLGTLSETGAVGGDPAGALYESAFADIRAAKYEPAEEKFKKFVESYPKHSLAGNAQYWLGETHYVRGNYQLAAKMFAQGYQDYPQGQKAADSLLKLGLSLAKMGNKEDACLSLQQIQKQFPGGTNTAAQRAQQEIKQLGCK